MAANYWNRVFTWFQILLLITLIILSCYFFFWCADAYVLHWSDVYQLVKLSIRRKYPCHYVELYILLPYFLSSNYIFILDGLPSPFHHLLIIYAIRSCFFNVGGIFCKIISSWSAATFEWTYFYKQIVFWMRGKRWRFFL